MVAPVSFISALWQTHKDRQYLMETSRLTGNFYYLDCFCVYMFWYPYLRCIYMLILLVGRVIISYEGSSSFHCRSDPQSMSAILFSQL